MQKVDMETLIPYDLDRGLMIFTILSEVSIGMKIWQHAKCCHPTKLLIQTCPKLYHSFNQHVISQTYCLNHQIAQIALMNKSSHEKSTKNTKYLYEDENDIIRCESVD